MAHTTRDVFTEEDVEQGDARQYHKAGADGTPGRFKEDEHTGQPDIDILRLRAPAEADERFVSEKHVSHKPSRHEHQQPVEHGN